MTDKPIDALKPCPHEGEPASIRWDAETVWVECNFCGARTAPCDTEELAIRIWNTRQAGVQITDAILAAAREAGPPILRGVADCELTEILDAALEAAMSAPQAQGDALVERFADYAFLLAAKYATADEARKLSDLRAAMPSLDNVVGVLRRLVTAARGLSHGVDWNKGTQAKTYRQQLLDAIPDAEAALASLGEIVGSGND